MTGGPGCFISPNESKILHSRRRDGLTLLDKLCDPTKFCMEKKNGKKKEEKNKEKTRRKSKETSL